MQETVSGSGISWAICKSAHHSTDNHASPPPHHSVFYRPNALPAAQITSSKHWRPAVKQHKNMLYRKFLYIILLCSFMLIRKYGCASRRCCLATLLWQIIDSSVSDRATYTDSMGNHFISLWFHFSESKLLTTTLHHLMASFPEQPVTQNSLHDTRKVKPVWL